MQNSDLYLLLPMVNMAALCLFYPPLWFLCVMHRSLEVDAIWIKELSEEAIASSTVRNINLNCRMVMETVKK